MFSSIKNERKNESADNEQQPSYQLLSPENIREVLYKFVDEVEIERMTDDGDDDNATQYFDLESNNETQGDEIVQPADAMSSASSTSLSSSTSSSSASPKPVSEESIPIHVLINNQVEITAIPAPVLEINCREVFQQALQKNHPSSAVQVILESISDATYKQYDGHIKNWLSYCKNHNYDYLKVSVPVVIDFLTDMFDNDASYDTINECKCALTLLLGNIVKHDYIKKFMKDLYKNSPCNPIHNFSWNPIILLNHLSTMWPNEVLTLETLGKKTITLLILVTSLRIRTISLLKLSNIYTQYGSEIIIKNKALQPDYPVLRLPYYNFKPEICLVRCLKAYIKKTSKIRKDDQLFISYRRPYHGVSSQQLSRWIKDTFKVSGIRTSVNSSHNICDPSTFNVRKVSVNMSVIIKKANWSDYSASVFINFYRSFLNQFHDDIQNVNQ